MDEYMQRNIEYCDIEYIIFDFDGVLYSAPTFEQEYNNYLIKIIHKLSVNGWPKQRIRELLAENNVINSDPNLRTDIHKFCEIPLGVLQKDFDEYCLNHYFLPKKSDIRVLSNDILRKLSKRRKLLLITNTSLDLVQFKANILGIDLSVFKNVYTPITQNIDSFSKYHQFHTVVNNYILAGLELYALGTNYDADLRPILRNGGSGLLVNTNDCSATERFLVQNFLSD